MKRANSQPGKLPDQVRYFIDTNVILYASGSEHPLKQPCVLLLEKMIAESLDAVISVEVIQEILHRYSSLRRAETGVLLARKTMGIFRPLLPVEPNDMQLATDLFERYKGISGRDAVHAAVSLNNGINHIISTDRDFDAIKEIDRVDPAEFARILG
jgi:predicted nucleic acid-binding protein